MFQKGHLVGGPRPLGHIVLGQAVAPTNQQPTAYSDSATTAYQTPVEIDLISNDIDLDGSIDASSAEVTTHPVNGVVTINSQNGVAMYTPHDGFSGADSFEYRVADMEGKWSEPVAVNLLVEPLRRNFTLLDATDNMYYEMEVPTVLAGDFELQFKVYTDTAYAQSGHIFFGESTDTKSAVLMFSSGNGLKVRGEDGIELAISTSQSNAIDNMLQDMSVVRKNDLLTMYVNGYALGSKVMTSDFKFDMIGTYSGQAYNLDGYMIDVKLWGNGTSENGALVWDLPLDDAGASLYMENLADSSNRAMRMNHVVADTESYTLNESTDPAQWESSDSSKVIPILEPVDLTSDDARNITLLSTAGAQFFLVTGLPNITYPYPYASCRFATTYTSSSVNNGIFGKHNDDRFYLMTKEGYLVIGTGGGIITPSGAPFVADGKEHFVELYKDPADDLLKLRLDGVEVYSAASSYAGDLTGFRIGGLGGVSNSTFTGMVYDLVLKNEGTTYIDVALDEDWIYTDTANNLGDPSVVVTPYNVGRDDAEIFVKNSTTDPVQWENRDLSVVIPIEEVA